MKNSNPKTFNKKARLEKVKRYPHFNELNDDATYKALRVTMPKKGLQFEERVDTVEIVSAESADRQIKEDKITKRFKNI